MGGGGGCCIAKFCTNCCVGKIIRAIIENFSSKGSRSGGQIDRFDADKADLQATIKVQKALTEFKTDTQNKCQIFEENTIKESREYLDAFISELRKYNKIRYGSRSMNININSIERENRKTEDTIHGFIVKRVSKRISLDDTECLEILKMDAGKAKEEALDAFYKKVLKEAVRELSDELQDIMEKQTDNVCERIQHRIDSIVDICEAKEAEFDGIRKVKEKDEDAVEQEQIRLAHHVALCEYGLAILG